MKLLDLHINGFGKLQDRSVEFSDELNIIYGKNETGKSTLHTFIQSMFFGLSRGQGRRAKTDTYSRFEPWNTAAGYGGYIRIQQNGTIYRIERDFRKDAQGLTITDETKGRELEPTKELMDFLLCGLTETSYMNTISIGQLKSATDGGMVAELKNYIANMNTAGNMALNITKATTFLRQQKEAFENQMVPEAARTYTALLGDIRKTEKEISSPEYENQLTSYQTMRTQMRGLLDEKLEEQAALQQKMASGRQILSVNQFSDAPSIRDYEKETKKVYIACQTHREALDSNYRTFWAVGMFLFSLASACMAILAVTTAAKSFTWLESMIGIFTESGLPAAVFSGLLGLFAFLFAAVGGLLVHRDKECRKSLEYSTKLLLEIFTRHLGDPSISEAAMDAFLSRMEEFLRLHDNLEHMQITIQEQADEITSLQQEQSSCEMIIEKQQQAQWDLEKKLEHLISCKDQAEALKPVLEENERLREEINSIDLSLETMIQLSTSIRNSFGLYLNKEASELISGITGGIYSSMSIDENLNVFMNTREKLVPIEQVSSGTMDQIYLALRLAAAKLVQSPPGDMPLIFDDSFVLYDDERLRTALRWLREAYGGQIIIFTCHQREAQMMTANQLPYHLITM